MRPNPVRYKYTRRGIWIGAIVGVILAVITGEYSVSVLGGFGIGMAIGLIIDLVFRKV